MTSAVTNNTDESTATLLRRVGWHILPLLMVLYLIAYLDRINIGFAASAMQRDLHFSDALYGTGAGVFFFGYLLAQVPSNLLLSRIGARRTLAGLMLAWGAVSASMASVHSATAFLALRFLLGLTEAGFYPGVILYLTLWLPRRVRTSFTAWFVFAIPLANIIGGPVSTWLLQRGGAGRFADWQVLLLTEAAPAMIVGALLPWLMTDSPAKARWLSEDDREQLRQVRAADEPAEFAGSATEGRGLLHAGVLVHLLQFAAVYFAVQVAQYSLSFWLPKILHSMHIAPESIGWSVAAVFAIAGVGMLLWGRVADRAPTSRWPLGAPMLLAAVGFLGTTLRVVQAGSGQSGYALLLVVFGITAAAALSCTACFWALATLRQRPQDVAVLIAGINALGNLGGFVGPTLFGVLEQATGNHNAGLMSTSAILLLGAGVLYISRRETSAAV